MWISQLPAGEGDREALACSMAESTSDRPERGSLPASFTLR